MGEFMKGIVHKEGGQIVFNANDYKVRVIVQMRPIELHMLPDGAIDDTPSFTIMLTDGAMGVIGQFSLSTLKETLNEVGFDVIKL